VAARKCRVLGGAASHGGLKPEKKGAAPKIPFPRGRAGARRRGEGFNNQGAVGGVRDLTTTEEEGKESQSKERQRVQAKEGNTMYAGTC